MMMITIIIIISIVILLATTTTTCQAFVVDMVSTTTKTNSHRPFLVSSAWKSAIHNNNDDNEQYHNDPSSNPSRSSTNNSKKQQRIPKQPRFVQNRHNNNNNNPNNNHKKNKKSQSSSLSVNMNNNNPTTTTRTATFPKSFSSSSSWSSQQNDSNNNQQQQNKNKFTTKKNPPLSSSNTKSLHNTQTTTTTKKTAIIEIEELEAKLEKRWGKEQFLKQPFENTIQQEDYQEEDDDEEYEEYDDDDTDDNNPFQGKSIITTTSFSDNRHRKINPENKLSKLSSSSSSSDSPLSAFTTTTTMKAERLMKVSHLIASQPAGGMGTIPKNFNNDNKDDRTIQTTTTTRIPPENKPSSPNTMARPILDPETLEPMVLTLEQAQRTFQQQQQSSSSSSNVLTPTTNENDKDEDNDDDNKIRPESFSWQDLGITDPLLIKNLQAMGAQTPLHVQSASIPSILQSHDHKYTRDVLISTYTGSGKTLAFLTPIVQTIIQDSKRQQQQYVLIIAPGRELASQIVTVARQLISSSSISAMLAIGGTTFARNLADIRKNKPNIIVGTPGRVAELLLGSGSEKRGRLKLPFSALVLDEFDALLEYKPHRDPTRAVLAQLKKQNPNLQTIMCSATASDVDASEYLRPDFVHVKADPHDTSVTDENSSSSSSSSTRVSRTVMHGVVHVPHIRFQYEYLRRILHTEPLPPQILIFGQDSRQVETIVDKLSEFNILAAPLHGGRQSTKMDRADVAKALRQGTVGIVVATELAARGLDAPITHVINLALPTSPSHYAHRAGRCGRNGRPGIVINMTTKPQERNVPHKFAEALGIPMHTIQVRNAKLNVIDPDSVNLDAI